MATEAPAATAPAEVAAADSAMYTVSTSVETIGGQRMLIASVTPQQGYKINVEYPRWGVQVAEDAVAVPGVRVGVDQATAFDEDGVIFQIPVADDEAAGMIAGTMRMSVCDDAACLMPTEQVQWELTLTN